MGTEYLMVAAIDFGTTFSGYAFSTRADFEKDPLKISANQAWVSGQRYLLSMKTPTTLLLTKAGKFVSFGYEAETKYYNIALENKMRNFLFFERFKMKLHQNYEVKYKINWSKKVFCQHFSLVNANRSQ